MKHQSTLGMTLIELLIALVVASIVASIALPSYRQHFLRVQRSEGRNELLQTAQKLELCFARFNLYNHADCAIAQQLPGGRDAGHYRIAAPVLTAAEYRLEAVPQGAQGADEDCRTLTLTSANIKGVSGGARKSQAWCWSH